MKLIQVKTNKRLVEAKKSQEQDPFDELDYYDRDKSKELQYAGLANVDKIQTTIGRLAEQYAAQRVLSFGASEEYPDRVTGGNRQFYMDRELYPEIAAKFDRLHKRWESAYKQSFYNNRVYDAFSSHVAQQENKKWEQGEQALLNAVKNHKDPQLIQDAVNYAKATGARWEQFEPYLLERGSINSIVDYAIKCYKNVWPEAEHVIIDRVNELDQKNKYTDTTANLLTLYASAVKNGRWKEAERYISFCPTEARRYGVMFNVELPQRKFGANPHRTR